MILYYHGKMSAKAPLVLGQKNGQDADLDLVGQRPDPTRSISVILDLLYAELFEKDSSPCQPAALKTPASEATGRGSLPSRTPLIAPDRNPSSDQQLHHHEFLSRSGVLRSAARAPLQPLP